MPRAVLATVASVHGGTTAGGQATVVALVPAIRGHFLPWFAAVHVPRPRDLRRG